MSADWHPDNMLRSLPNRRLPSCTRQCGVLKLHSYVRGFFLQGVSSYLSHKLLCFPGMSVRYHDAADQLAWQGTWLRRAGKAPLNFPESVAIAWARRLHSIAMNKRHLVRTDGLPPYMPLLAPEALCSVMLLMLSSPHFPWSWVSYLYMADSRRPLRHLSRLLPGPDTWSRDSHTLLHSWGSPLSLWINTRRSAGGSDTLQPPPRASAFLCCSKAQLPCLSPPGRRRELFVGWKVVQNPLPKPMRRSKLHSIAWHP